MPMWVVPSGRRRGSLAKPPLVGWSSDSASTRVRWPSPRSARAFSGRPKADNAAAPAETYSERIKKLRREEDKGQRILLLDRIVYRTSSRGGGGLVAPYHEPRAGTQGWQPRG